MCTAPGLRVNVQVFVGLRAGLPAHFPEALVHGQCSQCRPQHRVPCISASPFGRTRRAGTARPAATAFQDRVATARFHVSTLAPDSLYFAATVLPQRAAALSSRQHPAPCRSLTLTFTCVLWSSCRRDRRRRRRPFPSSHFRSSPCDPPPSSSSCAPRI